MSGKRVRTATKWYMFENQEPLSKKPVKSDDKISSTSSTSSSSPFVVADYNGAPNYFHLVGRHSTLKYVTAQLLQREEKNKKLVNCFSVKRTIKLKQKLIVKRVKGRKHGQNMFYLEVENPESNKKSSTSGKVKLIKKKPIKTTKSTTIDKSSKKTKKSEKKPKVTKSKPKRWVVNINPDIIPFDEDPFFDQKNFKDLPFVSTDNYSKLCIVAARNRDYKMLNKLISDVDKVSEPFIQRSLHCYETAFRWALRNEDEKIIRLLIDELLQPTKRVSSPQSFLRIETTGVYNFRSLGIKRIRKVQTARGSLEGNNALCQAMPVFSANHIQKETMKYCMKTGVSFKTLRLVFTLSKNEGYLQKVGEQVHLAAIWGHRELCRDVLEYVIEVGYILSYIGLGQLHFRVLKANAANELHNYRVQSVTKKSKSNQFITPLHLACINPNVGVLISLLEAYPEYSLADKLGYRLIHYAAVCEGPEPLKLLLKRRVNPYDVTNDGLTPLHVACKTGRLHNVIVLMEYAADAKKKQALSKPTTNTTIIVTSDGNANGMNDDDDDDDADIPDLSGEAKFGLGGINRPARNSFAPIHLAAWHGHTSVVKQLLSYEDINAQKPLSVNAKNITPLILACQKGYLDIVKMLVEDGKANVEQEDKLKRSPLIHAVLNGHTNVASYLLHRGANPNAADTSGNTVLMYAAAYGWWHCCDLLIKCGADVNTTNKWMTSALSASFLCGNTGIVRLLLQQPGMDVNFKDDEGRSLLMLACRLHVQKTLLNQVKFLLLDLKADAQGKNIHNQNALHIIAQNQTRNLKEKESIDILHELTELLIDCHCDLQLEDVNGRTPLSYAILSGNEDQAKLMLSKGAILGSDKLTADIIDNGMDVDDDEEEEEEKDNDDDDSNDDENEDEETEKGQHKSTLLHELCSVARQFSVVNLLKKAIETNDINKTRIENMVHQRDNNGCTPLLVVVQNYVYITEESQLKNMREYMDFLLDEMNADQNDCIKNSKPTLPVKPKKVTFISEDKTDEKKISQVQMSRFYNISLSGPSIAHKDGVSVLLYLCLAFNSNRKVYDEYLNTLKTFLKRKNVKIEITLDGRTPLLDALRSKLIDNALLLIEAGANVNVASEIEEELEHGKTPLMFAIWLGNVKMVKTLIEHKANLLAVDKHIENTALHYASSIKTPNLENEECLKLLSASVRKSHGNEGINQVNKQGRTPLHLAINFNSNNGADSSADAIEILLSHNASVSSVDKENRIPLHYAFVKMGKHKENSLCDPIELCQLMIDYGSSLTHADKYGSTVIHLAAVRGASVCISYLITRGALPDQARLDGNTPLSLAVRNKHLNATMTLIQTGVNVNVNVINVTKKEKSHEVYRCLHLLSSSQLLANDSNNTNDEDKTEMSVFQQTLHNGWQGVAYVLAQKLLSNTLPPPPPPPSSSSSTTSSSSIMNNATNHLRRQSSKKASSTTTTTTTAATTLTTSQHRLLDLVMHQHKVIRDCFEAGVMRLAWNFLRRDTFNDTSQSLACARSDWDGANLAIALCRYAETNSTKNSAFYSRILHLLLVDGIGNKKSSNSRVSVIQLDNYKCDALTWCCLRHNFSLASDILDMNLENITGSHKNGRGDTPMILTFWNPPPISDSFKKWLTKLLDNGATVDILGNFPYLDPLNDEKDKINCPYQEWDSSKCLSPGRFPPIKNHEVNQLISPLIASIRANHVGLVLYLLNECKADVNFADSHGSTPIMHALMCNNYKILRILLQKEYDGSDDFDERSKKPERKKACSGGLGFGFPTKRGTTIISAKIAHSETEDENENDDENEDEEENEEENEDEDEENEAEGDGDEEDIMDVDEEEEEKEDDEEEATDVEEEKKSEENKPKKIAKNSNNTTSSLNYDLIGNVPNIPNSRNCHLGVRNHDNLDLIDILAGTKQTFSFDNAKLLTLLYNVGFLLTPAHVTKLANEKSPHLYALACQLLKIPKNKWEMVTSKSKSVSLSKQNSLVSNADMSDMISDDEINRLAQEELKLLEKSDDKKETYQPKPNHLTQLHKTGVVICDSRHDNRPFDVLLNKVDIKFRSVDLFNFYKMQIIHQRGKNVYFLFTNWGRIGDPGQFQKTPFPTKEGAIKEFEKVFRQKTGNKWENYSSFTRVVNKYNLIKLEEKVKSVKRNPIDIKLDSTLDVNVHKDVAKLLRALINIGKLSTLLRQSSLDESRLPFGRLTSEDLKEAKELLANIAQLSTKLAAATYDIKNMNVEELRQTGEEICQLSTKYFTLVPQRGFENSDLAPLYDEHAISQQRELLSNLTELQYAGYLLLAASSQRERIHPIDFVYRSIQCHVSELLGETDWQAQMILRAIHASKPDVKVTGIFSLRRPAEKLHCLQRQTNHGFVGPCYLLWHGTSSANLLSILHQGLLIHPGRVYRTGRSFGDGIYFSDIFIKSYNYSSNIAQRRGLQKDERYALLCMVNLSDLSIRHEYLTDEQLIEIKNKKQTILAVGGQVPNPNATITINLNDDNNCASTNTAPRQQRGVVQNNKCRICLGHPIHHPDRNRRSGITDFNEYVVADEQRIQMRYLIRFLP